jgi:mycofactocin glycosyltransferase
LAGSTWSLARQVRRFGVPGSLALRWSVQGAVATGIGLGHALTVLGGPVLVVMALRNRRWAVTTAVLVAAPPLVEWWHERPTLDPLRWCLSSVADDVAYGAGVWWGCIRDRTVGPLVPKVRLRSPGAVPAPDVEGAGVTPMVVGEM